MKKKVILLVLGINICLGILLSFQTKPKNVLQGKNINSKSDSLSILINEDGKEYKKSKSNSIPKGEYILNEEKTYCKNNGKISNYDSNTGTVSFSIVGTDNCYLYFDAAHGWGNIVLDNSNGAGSITNAINYIKNKGEANVSKPSTSNEGLYATEDDLGMSYYFRGSVDNNWVKFGKSYSSNVGTCLYNDTDVLDGFYSKVTKSWTCNSSKVCNVDGRYLVGLSKETCEGDDYDGIYTDEYPTFEFSDTSNAKDMYWRIIRVNGDGSIRLIYTGTTAPTESQKVSMTGDDTQIGTSVVNSKASSDYSYKIEYTGFMYELGKQHGLTNDSTIKQVLEDWFVTTSLVTDYRVDETVADQIYCNDRTIFGSNSDGTGEYEDLSSIRNSYFYFGATNRTYYSSNNVHPTLKCANNDDRFTVGKINEIGNSTLIFPVGLITMDEVYFAGLISTMNRNENHYLYTNKLWYIGSPHANHGGEIVHAAVLPDTSTAALGDINQNYASGVRPVISLSSNVQLIGSGTWDDPYEVDY